MWIFREAGSEPDPVIFRMAPGSIKTIGRAPRADFIVTAALVSRIHCRLEAHDDSVEVIDLSSTNGTYVNDARVERAHVKDSDRLRVGRLELVVERAPTSSR